MNRRGFLGGILAAGMAPMVASAGVLMPVRPAAIILYGDGIHNDTLALQALFDGNKYVFDQRTGMYMEQSGTIRLSHGSYIVSSPLVVKAHRESLIEFDSCSFRQDESLPKPRSYFNLLTNSRQAR
jgi:hypothetical protein